MPQDTNNKNKNNTHTSFSGDIMEKDCAPINHGNELETDADQDPTGPVGNNLLPRLSLTPSDCMIYLSLFAVFSIPFLCRKSLVACVTLSSFRFDQSRVTTQNKTCVDLCWTIVVPPYKDFGFSLELSSITHSAQRDKRKQEKEKASERAGRRLCPMHRV